MPADYGTNPYTPPATDKWGNPQVTLADGSTTWTNNIGQLWDSNTQSWVDSTAPTALGNYYAGAQNAPSWSDISQANAAWLNASNEGRAGSRYDRMGFSEAPTNRELVDYGNYQNALGTVRDATQGALSTVGRGFSGPNWDIFNQPGQTPRDYWGLDTPAALPTNQQLQNGGYDFSPQGRAALAEQAWQNNPGPTIGDMAANLTSGNRLVSDVTGGRVDLNNLPYGLNYVTDTALAPATWLTAAAGSEVPIVGSAFKGGLAKRFAGETALGAAGLFGGQKSAELTATQTDNPWLIGGAGLLGGVATGLGALGAIKAGERLLPRVANAADGVGITPGKVLEGEYGGSHAVHGEPPMPNDFRTGNLRVTHQDGDKWLIQQVEPDGSLGLQVNATRAEAERQWARSGDNAAFVAADRAAAEALQAQHPELFGGEVTAAPTPTPSAAVSPESFASTVAARLKAEAAGGEVGALDMGAVSDIANAARHGNPVGRTIARVMPGGVEVTAPAIDTTPRIGELLHAPVLEGDYKPEQALRVGRNLERRAASVANTIDAEAAPAWKALGPTFKDKAGNVFLKNVAPSPAEVDAGLPGALAVRVVEKPGEYALTPGQAAAVKKLGDLTGSVANERDALGATVNRLTGEEGDIFQHRKALKNAAGEELNQQGGAGGSRLAIGKDKTRIFDDPVDAVKAGVVYADPKVAFAENVAGGLKKAVNAHVKTLLEPFGETAASRVSPELRAQVEGLRQKVTSMKATGARLGDKTDRIIDEFLKDPGANLDNLRDVLPVRVGPNAVGKVGVNFGKSRAELNQSLLDIRKQLNDLAPAWRKEIAASKSPRPGRVTIPQAIAPALIGTDFDKRTAARIISQYGGGIRVGDNVLTTSIPGVKRINSLLTPINATLDFSVTLNQLAILGANNKRAFVKNLGNSLADMFNDTRYNAWLADPKVADTAKWVTIYGDAGDQGDFLAKTLQRLPAFGQTQKQFARFGNRMRVDAFNSIEDSAAKSAGRALDDSAKEQIGRAVDRLSGVSMSRATDAERIAQFAPNFFRSIIETTAHAVSDGGLEGQIARQYLKNYAALGAGIVTATALAQNRDLGEVLNPFDKKAWARGEIKLNPNWMTIRVGGQDVNVFGTYDSAMRLLVVGADAGFRAINEKDANQLFDALGYAGGTKGSPVVKFVTDLIKGETFNHADPLNPVELGKRLLPISIQQGVQSAQEGKSPKDIAIETGLSAIGAKSNPVTDFEKKDQQAMDQYGKHWDELSPVEQNALKAVPGSPAATYESTNPDAVAAKARKVGDVAELRDFMAPVDTAHIDQATQLPKSYDDGKKWRDQYHIMLEKQQTQYDKDARDFPFTGQASTDPTRIALAERSALIKANKVGSDVNWDVIDAWALANPEKQKLIDAYFADPNKPNTDLTSAVTAYKAASKQIGDAGYWSVKDNVWTQLAAQDPTLSKYKTYYDWKDDVTAQVRAQATGAPDTVVATIVDNIIGKNPISKVYEKVSNEAETRWVIEHPDVARLAYLWGYLQPTKLEKVAIAAAESK